MSTSAGDGEEMRLNLSLPQIVRQTRAFLCYWLWLLCYGEKKIAIDLPEDRDTIFVHQLPSFFIVVWKRCHEINIMFKILIQNSGPVNNDNLHDLHVITYCQML
ncbi:unnamed protein product [Orchesella dallaii]|uniref:Uncharacterized protein n=1 Tax=Orchesella dallaii TaxID=48710 RepID=A0ABP1QML9_9HEXA